VEVGGAPSYDRAGCVTHKGKERMPGGDTGPASVLPLVL
jgi:hypothetical protein